MDYRHFSISKQHSHIYLIAHGFLGNCRDTFCGKLIQYLEMLGLNYCTFDFIGHGRSSGELANLDQMVGQFSQIYRDIASKYPENKIIPIGYSQGSAIVLKFLATQPEVQKAILFAPLSIPEILIAQRLDPLEIDWLKSGGEFIKDFGNGRHKALNKKWLESYYGFLNADGLKQIRANLDIFFACQDKIIDKIQNQFLLANLSNFNLYQVPKAEHTFNSSENWDFIKIYFPSNES